MSLLGSQDLHLHTTMSDGSLTCTTVVAPPSSLRRNMTSMSSTKLPRERGSDLNPPIGGIVTAAADAPGERLAARSGDEDAVEARDGGATSRTVASVGAADD